VGGSAQKVKAMSIQTSTNQNLSEKRRHDPTPILSAGQLRTTGALILIALGFVLFLGEARLLDYSSSWWVIFIAIPGLVLLGAGALRLRQGGAGSRMATTQLIVGGLCILLSIIFIIDPTWSFTRGWALDRYFPFLSGLNWDRIWPWLLAVPGAAILVSAYQRRSVRAGVAGGALVLVGLVFILNISWDVVWPLAIIAAGVGLLLGGVRRHN
jgi:hypothetical protein